MQLFPQITEPAAVPPRSTIKPPSEREAAALASLVPLHVSQTLPISDVLSDVFKLCRQRWVADFLFSPDLTPISAMSAPINLRHAITCTVTMTSVERAVGLPRCKKAPRNPFDVHLHGDYVFVPAFSVGGISVGFGVQNCAMRCQANWSSRRREQNHTALSHFRYVRDEGSGVLMKIHDMKDTDIVKVDYMAHETTMRRRRAFISMERETIHEALRNDTAGLDPGSLVPAIRILQTSVELRDCPLCCAPRGSTCACRLELKPPKHPLDFDNMVLNMSSHLGSFEGTTAARFCTGGMELMSARLGSRINIDCTVDADLIAKLSAWAISDHLKDVKEDPLRCIMPAADYEMADIGGPMKLGRERALPSDVTAEGSIAMGLAIDSAIEMGDIPVGEVSEFLDPLPMPLRDGDLAASAAIAELTTATDNHLLGDALAGEPFMEELSPDSGEGEVDDDLELANQIAYEAQVAFQQENELGEQSVPSASSHWQQTELDSGAGGVGGSRGRQALCIAPAGQAEPDEQVVADEKERKAELRRQRNREAAQRSNLKRKQRNDTLKAQLRVSHLKAAELRAKELVLREEHIRLRRRLASSSS